MKRYINVFGVDTSLSIKGTVVLIVLAFLAVIFELLITIGFFLGVCALTSNPVLKILSLFASLYLGSVIDNKLTGYIAKKIQDGTLDKFLN